MSRLRLILRSLRFHWRTNLGVVAGVMLATAVIVGALVVGDSVRGSLRDMALARLGDTHSAMSTGDRLFTADLAKRIASERDERFAAALDLPGIATAGGGQRRANGVHIIGVDERFGVPVSEGDGIYINRRLADQLDVKTGDRISLRVQKPSALPRDIPLGSEVDESVRLNGTVLDIVSDEGIGRFSLSADQIPPFNAFVPIDRLQKAAEVEGRANMLLVQSDVPANELQQRLDDHVKLADFGLQVVPVPGRDRVELRSDRVFIEQPIVDAALAARPRGEQLLTYFVNELAANEKATPYSMVTALESLDIADDQIVVTDWLAEDLSLKVGDAVTLRYWIVGPGRQLIEQTARFTVKSIVPTSGGGAGAGAIGDKAMLPDFAGLADVDSSREWNPGIPIDLNRIRDKDEAYWKEHRGTPKAFVSLNWAKQHWGNRFGEVTAIRWAGDESAIGPLAAAITQRIDPASVGMAFRPVRAEALAASQQGTDFGGLFIGLSFFIVVAALLLTAMLFVFGVEQRSSEQGLLLAAGFTPAQVRGLVLVEGGVLAIVGALLGAGLGVAYTHGILWALTTIWQGAVAGTSGLRYHAEWSTLVIGTLSAAVVAVLTMAWAMRRQTKQPVRALLAARYGFESPQPRGRGRMMIAVAVVCAIGAVAIVIAKPQAAGAFFGAGALLLIAGLSGAAAMLRRTRSPAASRFDLARLGFVNTMRRRGRSIATVTMLACGVFLVVSINAFRHGPSDEVPRRDSGTGGFALYAETALPVYHDLNTQSGRDAFALGEAEMRGVSIVPLRLREGDEASCLNLNMPRQSAIVGVDPQLLAERGAFEFVRTLDGESTANPWLLLEGGSEQTVPAIVDDAVAQWILKKGLGDTISYTDERGNPFDVKIVGTISNSILQGHVIISEAAFTRRFPSVGGYRVMLIDAPWDKHEAAQRTLERALADVGIVAMTTPARLAMFSAVENTYLTIFSVLGGLGLLLGGAGLALVVLRNVMERRSELAAMRAMGFSGQRLRWMVLGEHWMLLAGGLVIGVAAAVVAIVPALSDRQSLPIGWIALILAGLLVTGLAWVALATAGALSGRLTAALRND